MDDLNRIKVVLVEKKKTNKWLAKEMGKDPATVSKHCSTRFAYLRENSFSTRRRCKGFDLFNKKQK